MSDETDVIVSIGRIWVAIGRNEFPLAEDFHPH